MSARAPCNARSNEVTLIANLVDEIQPKDPPAVWAAPAEWSTIAGLDVVISPTFFRIDDAFGYVAGLCALQKPAIGMSKLAAATLTVDPTHLERMQAVEHADRRSAAILMADVEASSPLARRLSTASYFSFCRRLIWAADECVVNAGGIVGRHAGDGVVAEKYRSRERPLIGCKATTRRDGHGPLVRPSSLAKRVHPLGFGSRSTPSASIGRMTSSRPGKNIEFDDFVESVGGDKDDDHDPGRRS